MKKTQQKLECPGYICPEILELGVGGLTPLAQSSGIQLQDLDEVEEQF